ncbi:hypothetical protein [Bailinhaonella thermotolerans]|uniref:hypothetical protein n=1 Tax=Bailinhaonella thermotolerans TaxID=1070861 RepID=UPI0011C39BB7|nr:hypothetical protein [Bailinhaonella thermotolerans]
MSEPYLDALALLFAEELQHLGAVRRRYMSERQHALLSEAGRRAARILRRPVTTYVADGCVQLRLADADSTEPLPPLGRSLRLPDLP